MSRTSGNFKRHISRNSKWTQQYIRCWYSNNFRLCERHYRRLTSKSSKQTGEIHQALCENIQAYICIPQSCTFRVSYISMNLIISTNTIRKQLYYNNKRVQGRIWNRERRTYNCILYTYTTFHPMIQGVVEFTERMVPRWKRHDLGFVRLDSLRCQGVALYGASESLYNWHCAAFTCERLRVRVYTVVNGMLYAWILESFLSGFFNCVVILSTRRS